MTITYSKAKLADSKTSVELVLDSDEDSSFFRGLEERNIKLNAKQIEAVRHDKGPALVISAAGSGKTGVLTNRVSRLITVEKVKPEEILLITFTRKAADEMVERLGKLPFMSSSIAKKVNAGTFHSVFLSILRENGERRDIWSSSRSQQITIKTILRSLGIEKFYESEDILSLISSYKNNLIDLSKAPKTHAHQKEFNQIWKKYEEYKQTNGLIDFGDMILNTYKLLSENPTILERVRNKYKYILIDEYQDSNFAQDKLVEMIAYPHNNIFVVGDARQVIYSFNGARIDNILNFPNKYPNTKIIPLDVNYRSTDWIVGLGDSIIADSKSLSIGETYSTKESEIKPKFILPESAEEEATRIINEIERIVESENANYKDFAILYRNASNSRAIFEEMLMREIPFVSYGSEETFYENTYVKPLLSYLRLTVNPNDTKAIADVLPTLYVAKEKLNFITQSQKNSPIKFPLEYILDSNIKPFQKSKISERCDLIKRLHSYRPIIALRMLREEYERYLIGEESETNTTLHKEIIKETLDEFEGSSKRFEDIESFLKFIDNVIKNSKIQKELQKKVNYDAIKLMTIHKSKGLEFPHVYIISVCDGVIPHKSALEECTDVIGDQESLLEEELRLLYVGATRSKEFLTISSPRMIRNKEMLPSRFINKYLH